MSTNPSAFSPGLVKQAATPLAGFALQNATPTILTWTAPNDGQMHRVLLPVSLIVTSLETGGAVNLSFTDPSNTPRSFGLFNGGLAAGAYGWGNNNGAWFSVLVFPGTAVSLVQSSALTVGAASIWAELWAS